MQNDIKAIADHYGYEPQSRQLIEEMAELTIAINKYWRSVNAIVQTPERAWETDKAAKNIAEEIADVEIVLEQMKYMLGNSEVIEDIKQQKITRQLYRIKEEVRNG